MTRLDEALAALRAGRHGGIKLGAGDFKVLGGPRRKPKHIEVLGRRKGEVCELHIEFEGRIRKSVLQKLWVPKRVNSSRGSDEDETPISQA